ncbi:MAG TPA: hypothetical protein ENG33_04710 [Chloroflexi bacterium]|nr:hypothetical protein [Chloroflexota bacterium]
MAYFLTQPEKEWILRKLQQTFDRATAETMVEILDQVMAIRYEEMGDLRQAVQGLIRAHEKAEERLTRLEATVQELVEAQKETEARVQELTEAQKRTEAKVRELTEAQNRTEVMMHELIKVQEEQARDIKKLKDDMSSVKGRLLEIYYHRRAGAYFGRILRRVKALLPSDLEEELESKFTPRDWLDLLQLDLLVQGRPRERKELGEVWLAVEISAVVDRCDVERALRRAEHLQRVGYLAIPAVAGEEATQGARVMACQAGVVMILDGQVAFWDEAVERALAAKKTGD